MDKFQALQNFWSMFGLTAYDETSVPDNATMPYITYESGFATLDEPVSLTGSVWYRSSSWSEASQKAQEISNGIGRGGIQIPYTDGTLWVTRGRPFAQRLQDQEDDMIRQIYINLEVEYTSAN